LATTRGRAAGASGDEKATRKTARKAAARKTTARRTRSRSAGTEPAEALARLFEQLTSVSTRLEAIEARLPPSRPEQGSSEPAAAPADLQAVTRRLSEALAEVPRAADFEPLAEHIYELARHAPRLLEALEAVPAAMAPFEQSVASLRETAETLQYVHESFAESLLRLPRAEDYEPLARPLAEFARVSPALAESLADVLRVTAPLSESVAGLRRVSDELRATRDALGRGGGRSGAPDADSLAALESTAADLRDARAALEAALESLPRDPEYKKVADQLREIASVSPSLMEWLQQVTPLSRPLGESVAALREAGARLEDGHARLLEAIERLRG
jgi:DNA repair ATPase RecN